MQPATLQPFVPATMAAPTPAPFQPTPLPLPAPDQPGGGRGSQPIINWVKFWDTLAIAAAYPWLCCGVALILLVPVTLLFLEIKGRRRPPMPPEPPPKPREKEEKKEEEGDQEAA